MREQQGFTIMELIIVIGLSSILLLGLLNLFDWHQRVYRMEEGDIRVTSSVRNSLSNMSEYLAQGYAIISTRNIDGVDYTTGGTTVIVQIPSINSDDDPIADVYDYVTFYLHDNKLYQRVEPGSGSVRHNNTKLLAENVQTFSLTYNNVDPTAASAVTINLTCQITLRNTSTATARVSDTIFLRNR